MVELEAEKIKKLFGERRNRRPTISGESRCVFPRKESHAPYAASPSLFKSAPIRILLPTFRAGLSLESAVTHPKSHNLGCVMIRSS